MTKLRNLFKCDICGNVVEVVHTGALSLVCCGQPMVKLTAKTEEGGYEKHVPVITTFGEGILVAVGSVPHPMEEKHAINFIEAITSDKVHRAELTVGQKPEAVFAVKKEDVVKVRAYCNIHGLWKK
ncbi:MAG: desulfoferrodoxin [bacterium]|nr:desulfoferrodoxin [bacterium]